MYTRCPACEAAYELHPRELAEAAGVVRCSNCGKTFNSLAALFAEKPEEYMKPMRGRGMPPLLGHRIYQQHEIPGLDEAPPRLGVASDEADAAANTPEQRVPAEKTSDPRAWVAAAAALLILLIVQSVGWFDTLGQWFNFATSDNRVTPAESMALVSRDLHAHPSRDDAVIISATLRNQGTLPVDLPVLELRLFDSSNQMLGVRRFQPEEYLPASRPRDQKMAPGLDLPVILDVVVTGSQPAGFEFRFF